MKRLLLIVLTSWSEIAAGQSAPDGGLPVPETGQTTPAGDASVPESGNREQDQRAAEATEHAKMLYDAGSKLYEVGEYRAAVESFRKAYSVLPDPLFLFNIAQAYRKLDDCDNARTNYRAYLRDEPAADNRAQVDRLIATMDECVAARSTTASRSNRLRLAGIITAAAGATITGAGIYFSLDARRQARNVEETCFAGCATGDVAAADQRGLAAERNAVVLYTVGGAALAAGVTMLVWASLRSDSHPSVTPTPGGGVVTVRF